MYVFMRMSPVKSPCVAAAFDNLHPHLRWIGLQENWNRPPPPTFHGKHHGFRWTLSLEPIQWHVVFLWFSYVFPMVFLWFPIDIPKQSRLIWLVVSAKSQGPKPPRSSKWFIGFPMMETNCFYKMAPPQIWSLVYKPWNNSQELSIVISTILFATEIRQLNAIDWGPHPVPPFMETPMTLCLWIFPTRPNSSQGTGPGCATATTGAGARGDFFGGLKEPSGQLCGEHRRKTMEKTTEMMEKIRGKRSKNHGPLWKMMGTPWKMMMDKSMATCLLSTRLNSWEMAWFSLICTTCCVFMLQGQEMQKDEPLFPSPTGVSLSLVFFVVSIHKLVHILQARVNDFVVFWLHAMHHFCQRQPSSI